MTENFSRLKDGISKKISYGAMMNEKEKED